MTVPFGEYTYKNLYFISDVRGNREHGTCNMKLNSQAHVACMDCQLKMRQAADGHSRSLFRSASPGVIFPETVT
jgi:hypothetical protein